MRIKSSQLNKVLKVTQKSDVKYYLHKNKTFNNPINKPARTKCGASTRVQLYLQWSDFEV
jgi:hypothetical protein